MMRNPRSRTHKLLTTRSEEIQFVWEVYVYVYVKIMEIGTIMPHQNLEKLKYRQSCHLFQFHSSFHMCIFVYNAPFVRLLFLLHQNLLGIATSMPPGTNIAIIHVGKIYLSWWMLMYVHISPHVSDWCLNMSLCYTLLIFNSPGSPLCLVYRCLRVCAPGSVSVYVPVQGAPVRSMSVWMSINDVKACQRMPGQRASVSALSLCFSKKTMYLSIHLSMISMSIWCTSISSISFYICIHVYIYPIQLRHLSVSLSACIYTTWCLFVFLSVYACVSSMHLSICVSTSISTSISNYIYLYIYNYIYIIIHLYYSIYIYISLSLSVALSLCLCPSVLSTQSGTHPLVWSRLVYSRLHIHQPSLTFFSCVCDSLWACKIL